METKNNKMAKTKSTAQSIYDKFCEVNKHTNIEELTPSEISSLNENGVDVSKLKPASRGGRPCLFSVEQELLICSLIEKGFSITSVADQFKVCPKTIRNIVERNRSTQ